MIGSRLQLLYEDLEARNILKSKKEFAKILGVDYGSLSKYLTDKVNLSINNLNYEQYKKYNINLEWLFTGEGEMFLSKENYHRDMSRIPVISQKVSCGNGQKWDSEQNIIDYVDIGKLVPKFSSKRIYGIRAVGTSMLGADIKDGDIILFSAEEFSSVEDGIYVFALDGEAYCKRLEFDKMSSTIKIFSLRVSDLQKAELIKTLHSDDFEFTERFQIFGKVFSVIRNLRH